MTPAQKKTAKVGLALLMGALVLVGIAFWWELNNLDNGATFSEVIWYIYANQPWAAWIPAVLFLIVLLLLYGHWFMAPAAVYESIRKGTWWKGGGAAVLLLLCASSTHAAEPPLQFDTWQVTGSLIKPGSERLLIVGARAQADLQLAGHVRAYARLTATAISDGGAAEVRLEDPESFTSAEVLWGARVRVRGPLQATAFWGLTVPLEGGRPALVERYPRTYGAGALTAIGEGYALVGMGAHEAAGPGLKTLFAAHIPLEGRVSAVADGAIGGASFLRFGIAVRIQ